MIPATVLLHRAENELTTLEVRLAGKGLTATEISELIAPVSRLLAELRAAI